MTCGTDLVGIRDFGIIKELLQNVSQITNTDAICAGGAARDIITEHNISDYDIYVKTPNLIGNTLEDFILPAIHQKLIEMFGKDVSDPSQIGEPWYEDSYIYRIYEFNILHMQNIQFIFTNPKWNLVNIAEQFPFSLSQAWITKDSVEVHSTPLFDKSLEKRIAVYNHRCRSAYLSKMITKFRGFAIMPINHAFSQAQIPSAIRAPMEIPF